MQCRRCNPVQCPTARAVVVNSSSREAVGDARRAARRRRRSCDSTGVDEVATNRVGACRFAAGRRQWEQWWRAPLHSTKCAPTTSVTCTMRKVRRVAATFGARATVCVSDRRVACHGALLPAGGAIAAAVPGVNCASTGLQSFAHSWLPVQHVPSSCCTASLGCDASRCSYTR